MSKIEWNDSLSVGVGLIDEQHKMLIKKLRDLSESFKMGHEQDRILRTLDFMIDYTDFHFTTEEKHMAEHSYSGLKEQKKQHEEFKETLYNILEDYKEEGPTKALAESINTFLLNWLVNHIKGSDQKLGKFFAEKGLANIK